MSSMSAACAAAMQTEGVLVMCVDTRGFVCTLRAAFEVSAGAVAAIAAQAVRLGSDAVVTMESPRAKSC